MELRRSMAEAGLNYEAAEAAFKKGDIRNKLEAANTPAEDIEEIVNLVQDHFKLGTFTIYKQLGNEHIISHVYRMNWSNVRQVLGDFSDSLSLNTVLTIF